MVPSDRPLLTAIYDVGDVHTISENDSKGINCFNNTGSDVELNCEIYLQDLVTLAKSKNLSANAFKHLLYKKNPIWSKKPV